MSDATAVLAPRIAPAHVPARGVGLWLLSIAALVFAMVVLGGVTRLTDSGLSMVDWQPIMGVLPPLGDAAWQEVFARYQAFPEYQKVNLGMTLAEFKAIYWFEYAHRLLGRAIGVAFLVPFVVFVATRRIPRAMAPKLAGLFVLGGLQGLLGWYMVQSGLVDRPDVSQYRLVAHLGLATLIYGLLLWSALDILAPRTGKPAARSEVPQPLLAGLVVWLFVVILSGGFVAGLDAGFAYNTFPLMDGRLVPAGLFDHAPWIANFFENTITVQFVHRVLAMLTALAVAALWLHAALRRPSARMGRRLHILACAVAVQVGLGITTLLLVVPVPLAAAHQAGGLFVFSAAIFVLHGTREAGA